MVPFFGCFSCCVDACWRSEAFWFDNSMPPLAAPGLSQSEQITELELQVPPISAYRSYVGRETDAWRNENPFVPWLLRKIEQQEIERDGIDTPPELKPEKEKKDKRPPPEFIVDPLVLSDLPVPHLVSYISAGNIELLNVRFDDEGELFQLSPGETAQGWTFLGGTNALAVLRNSDEVELSLPIGVGFTETEFINAIAAGADEGDLGAAAGAEGAATMQILALEITADVTTHAAEVRANHQVTVQANRPVPPYSGK